MCYQAKVKTYERKSLLTFCRQGPALECRTPLVLEFSTPGSEYFFLKVIHVVLKLSLSKFPIYYLSNLTESVERITHPYTT